MVFKVAQNEVSPTEFFHVWFWRMLIEGVTPSLVDRCTKVTWKKEHGCFDLVSSQADHPLLVGAVVDGNLSNDLSLFID